MLTQNTNQSGARLSQPWAWGLLCFLALFLGLDPAHAATFKATLDRDHLQVGETATLTLSFEGGQPSQVPQIPRIPNLQLSEGGTSRNVSIVNGQVTSTFNWTVGVTPLQPGDYTIPAVQAEIDGQRLTSAPLRLKADRQGATGGSDALALMRIILPKAEAFTGEALTVELQVFVRNGVANAENILQYFESLGSTPLKAEGFSIIRTANTGRRRAQSGENQYVATGIATSLVPVRPGSLNIEANPVELILQIPSGQRRRDSVFDPFGMFQSLEQRKLVLTAEPQAIKIIPLPAQGSPAGFNGAVGSFDFKVTASPTNVAAGDPITLKIELTGRGPLESLNLPGFTWDGFKSYPATAKLDFTDQLAIQGTKSFEQVVVPQTPDIRQVPSLQFSYFDPAQKAYRTLTHPAVPLVVRPSSNRGPEIAAPRGEAEETPQNRDIVHIKPRPGTLARPSPPLLPRPGFLVLAAFPVLVWLAALLWRRRADQLQNNPRLRRQRHVAALVRDGLNDLRAQASSNEPQAFFATVFRLLQEQLGERLDLAAASITEAVIEEHLKPKGTPEAVILSAQELFQLCNVARYAPISGSQELSALVPKVQSTLEQLRGLKV